MIENIGVKLVGNVTWVHRSKDGSIIAMGQKRNLLLQDGQEVMVDRLGGLGGAAAITVIAIGDSDSAASMDQTDLQGTELHYHTCTNSRVTNNKLVCYSDFAAGHGTGTIKETVCADTNAAKGARKCLARCVIGPIVKAGGDTVTIIWEFIFAEV